MRLAAAAIVRQPSPRTESHLWAQDRAGWIEALSKARDEALAKLEALQAEPNPLGDEGAAADAKEPEAEAEPEAEPEAEEGVPPERQEVQVGTEVDDQIAI